MRNVYDRLKKRIGDDVKKKAEQVCADMENQ